MTRIGLAYRPPLASCIELGSLDVDCLELTAELFYKGGRGRLAVLGRRFPLLLHTQRLSLGSPGGLDPSELAWFAAIAEEARPLWISEHLGFRATSEIDLGTPNPLPLNDESLDAFVGKARQIVERCGAGLLVENIAYDLRVPGSLSEQEFLNRFCDRSGCGVLLDLAALFVNGKNHGFDPGEWLGGLDLRHVVQLRVGGCSQFDGRWRDSHDVPVNDGVWNLAEAVLVSPSVAAAVLQRDARFPSVVELGAELDRLRAIVAKCKMRSAGATVSEYAEPSKASGGPDQRR